eukprot:CAMPEP_0176034230 /NCGR_PEP_ID=MMETSP0120_2-20121206/16918_1 /TAXON_ID=160619 /ORGANISM="Kryptoperidinium foliaceum, Strain CCMP 1326" /LENGTH=60 /DNA_ID=CAMNT_0017367569 /DNA_START=49 /DNA_END=231 /DNA_ORIENTATION=+
MSRKAELSSRKLARSATPRASALAVRLECAATANTAKAYQTCPKRNHPRSWSLAAHLPKA